MTAIPLRPWWSVLLQYAAMLRRAWRLPAAERPPHPHHDTYIGF